MFGLSAFAQCRPASFDALFDIDVAETQVLANLRQQVHFGARDAAIQNRNINRGLEPDFCFGVILGAGDVQLSLLCCFDHDLHARFRDMMDAGHT